MNVGQWIARHRLLLVATVLFLLFAPAALFAVPLALLLAFTGARSRSALVTMALAGGFSAFWLLQPGNLPDQVVRAGTLIASVVFVLGARLTAATVTHRALASVALAAVAVGNLLYSLESSWQELSWWVERSASQVARQQEFGVWMMCYGGETADNQLSEVLEQTVRFVADYHAAIVAVQLMAGLALATAIFHRVARQPVGAGLGRFRDFRFNDNLGWVAIVPLLVIVIPGLGAFRLIAGNVLLVFGVLYAMRGLSVAACGLERAGRNRGLSIVLSIAVALLILPIALAGAILLGVVDSRLDLRARMGSTASK